MSKNTHQNLKTSSTNNDLPDIVESEIEFLLPKEVSAILRVTEDTLKNSRSTGTLFGFPAPKFIQAGKRKILYRKETVMDWAHEHLKEIKMVGATPVDSELKTGGDA
ncbi:AlpA family transcriptional regulator [Thiomicrorhabdus sp. 6S3-12]|uniref:helix-turn-helix transcriptional regulator n=1 Tax=Thiomicrorhabdus sp. 6S3-12 TaxID=2819681 RepID=UPI001AAD438F|nr:hypothetical protein [Thiomicrorhabdus sp. 6S3-12]MBO1924574.1 hypothetical protein [Thiomicrorhabdus sp. 6S3-12]